MSAMAWLIIAIVGFSLAGIALVAAVIMFIKMNIPAIIGDLTGKTVAREIKAMRESNASSGDKRFRPSAVNLERGTVTEKVAHTPLSTSDLKKAHASKRLDKTGGLGTSGKLGGKKGGTVGLAEGNSTVNPVVEPANATEKLSDNATEVLSNGTEVLNSGATDVLSPATEVLSNGTEVLSNGTTVLSSGTTVLSGTEELTAEDNVKPVSFKVVRSEVMIHSDEVIE